VLLKITASLAGVALVGSAAAEDVNVQTAADTMKVGGEFRSEWIYDNHGLEKTDGNDPDSTSAFQMTAAKIKFKGNLNKDTEYAFRFNLFNPDRKGPLEYGYGTHWFGKALGFSFGQMKVLQGGFDNIDGSYRTHVKRPYQADLAYETIYEPMLAAHVMAAGKITLQILNDKTVSATDPNRWNQNKTQTWALGYRGKFGPIEPMLNYGSYDNNKSSWMDVGIKTEMAGLVASVDYWMDKEVLKGRKVADNKPDEVEQTSSNIAVNLGYVIKDTAMPWVYFSTYEKKQADTGASVAILSADAETGETTPVASEDRKYNTAPDKLDDNAVVWGVGADLLMFGKGWSPFVALIGTSGKFQKAAGGEETRSSLQAKVGVLGEI
jgi:hypothetical protein